MTDIDFAAVGRQHVIEQIEALESSEPGLLPMFYMTCTYEGDIRAAELLRERFEMPRPAEVSARISAAKTAHVERVAIAAAEREVHERMMREDWIYWLGVKLGLRRSPVS